MWNDSRLINMIILDGGTYGLYNQRNIRRRIWLA